MKKLTTEEFVEKARIVHGNIYDYSKVVYINSRKKVCIICPEHGEFWLLANNHLRGHKCPLCYCTQHASKVCSNKPKKNIVKTTEQFVQKAKIVHGDKYDYSKVEYISSQTKVCIICLEHGQFWQTPNRHLAGLGCPRCKYAKQILQQRNTTDDFINKANKIHHNFYDYSKVNYITNRVKVLITCPKHGEFVLEPHEHLAGYGCKKCLCKTQTKIFNELLPLVPDLQYEVTKTTVPWLGRLRLDMYSLKYNFAVECDGLQHYMPVAHFGGEAQFIQTKLRDALKNSLCEQNNCTLFRIQANYTSNLLNELKQQIQNLINLYLYESK